MLKMYNSDIVVLWKWKYQKVDLSTMVDIKTHKPIIIKLTQWILGAIVGVKIYFRTSGMQVNTI